MNICQYCSTKYFEDREHVFPYGLGGQDIYVDFVCSKCNNIFSGLEVELYQKSIIAIERSIEGIEGYKPTKDKPSPLKTSMLLIPDEKENIIYEGGQFHEFQVFLRPQIILKDNEFYLEGDSEESINRLLNLFTIWKTSSLIIVEGSAVKKGCVNSYYKIEKFDSTFRTNFIQEQLKVKHEIRIDILPESHGLHNNLTPRLFLDDRDVKNNRLRIRAKTIEQAILFLTGFLNYISVPRKLNSYPNKNIDNALISVGLSWDGIKFERALTKVALNCLMHYFPQAKNDSALNHLIEYVYSGKGFIKAQIDNKNEFIDNMPKNHNIFFYQMDEHFSIRISLFNGAFVFIIYIPGLYLLPKQEYNRLCVDYKKRINIFQDHTGFLKSFNVNS